jgi:hypothetical protein
MLFEENGVSSSKIFPNLLEKFTSGKPLRGFPDAQGDLESFLLAKIHESV